MRLYMESAQAKDAFRDASHGRLVRACPPLATVCNCLVKHGGGDEFETNLPAVVAGRDGSLWDLCSQYSALDNCRDQ